MPDGRVDLEQLAYKEDTLPTEPQCPVWKTLKSLSHFCFYLLVLDAPLQTIITPVKGTEREHMAETVADCCPSLGPLLVAKIPVKPPLTRKQFEDSIQYWPVNFHEDKK